MNNEQVIEFLYNRAPHGNGANSSVVFSLVDPEHRLIVAKYLRLDGRLNRYVLDYKMLDTPKAQVDVLWSKWLEEKDGKDSSHQPRKRSWRLEPKFDEIPEDFALEDYITEADLVQRLYDEQGLIVHYSAFRDLIKNKPRKVDNNFEKQVKALAKQRSIEELAKGMEIFQAGIASQMAQYGSITPPQEIKNLVKLRIERAPTNMTLNAKFIADLALAGFQPYTYSHTYDQHGDIAGLLREDPAKVWEDTIDPDTKVAMFFSSRGHQVKRCSDARPNCIYSAPDGTIRFGDFRKALKAPLETHRQAIMAWLNNDSNFKSYHVYRTKSYTAINYLALATDMTTSLRTPITPQLLRWLVELKKLPETSLLAKERPWLRILHTLGKVTR